MIESPVLREPGLDGAFEPNTSSVSLSFGIDIDIETLLRPTTGTWQLTYRVLHELAHFYQFYTTSWGLLHQLLGRTEFILVSGFLREYADSSSTLALPLLEVGQSTGPLPNAFQSDDARGLLRCVYLLEQLRRHVFGYEVAAPGLLDEEWRELVGILYEGFGIPKVIVWGPDDPPQTHGFRIDDLLESHAHALSSLWMFQAVERYGLDDEIRDGVLRIGNRYANGPYGTLLRFAGEFPIAEKMQLSMLCAICDLALNLLDPRAPLGLLANPAAEVHVFQHGFDPVSNALDLIAGVIDGRYPTLGEPGSPDTLIDPFLDGLASVSANGQLLAVSVAAANLAEDDLGLGRIATSPLVETMQAQVDRELLYAVSLDIVGSFAAADRLRRQHQPLLLGGVMIEDLAVLLSNVGAPSFLISQGEDSRKPAFRTLIGLTTLGARTTPYDKRADWDIVKTDIEVVATLRNLLVAGRDEFSVAEPTFGQGSLNPREVLAAWWGLHIDDFE